MDGSLDAPAAPVLLDSFTEQDVRRALGRSLLWVGAAAVAAGPVLSLWQGWQSWLLFVVGAAISATGTFEWMRMMSAIIARMERGRAPRPMFRVLTMFFMRLALAGLLLYASLYSLHGSGYALLAGLAASLFAVLAESFRLMAKAASTAAAAVENPEKSKAHGLQ